MKTDEKYDERLCGSLRAVLPKSKRKSVYILCSLFLYKYTVIT